MTLSAHGQESEHDFYEGFGRFGYGKVSKLPGFEIDSSGFKTAYSGSDRFSFSSPLKQWNPVQTNAWRQVIICDGGPGKPSKLRFDLADYGICMYFPAGIELRVRSVGAPWMSWKEGTVKENVPTPSSDWIAVTFQDQQPALVFGFPEDKTSLQVTGELGEWVIKSPRNFKGWVRISLPFGTEAYQGSTVTALGRLANRCKEEEELWFAPIADMPTPTLTDDGQGVEAEWKLPRKKTVIPNIFFLAQLGGYPARILSPHKLFPSSTNEGPVVLSENGTLKMRFPLKRLPSGRGLSLGEPIPQTLAQSNWSNPLRLVDLALANTVSGRDRSMSERARQAMATFFDLTGPSAEPITKLTTFYKSDGGFMLETAVHGLMAQSVRTGELDQTGEDPQVVSLGWRLDPYSGGLGLASDDSRRILAISAVAGSFSSSSRMRLQAAMFQCALSAERGMNVWRRRRSEITVEPKLLEPMAGIRKGLFSLNQVIPVDPVVEGWQSDLRCYGDIPAWLGRTSSGYELCWHAKDKIIGILPVESGYGISFSSKDNLQSLYTSQRIGYYELRFQPQSAGTCSANVYVPLWAPEFPLTSLPPVYTETRM